MPRQLKSLATALALATVAISVGTSVAGTSASAQEPPPRYQSQDAQDGPSSTANPQQPQAPDAQPANGQRQRSLPTEAYAVVPGTKFLVRLEEDLGTKDTPENTRFKVRTLEPLEAGSGIYLPPGAEIIGHVTRVEPAGVAGRAKLYLTFDEIRTKFGHLPIVAEVISVPGDHSVKAGPLKEGLIEGRHST